MELLVDVPDVCGRVAAAQAMASVRHLNNAPIAEGLIDIQVRLKPEMDLAVLARLEPLLGSGYVRKGEIVHQQVKVEIGAAAQATTHAVSRGLGHRYHATNDLSIVQVRLNGMTVSHMAPYRTWDDLFAEARRMWSIYADVVSPEAVTRVATRFINNLKLPMRQGDPFEAYLTASPQVPQPLPQSIMAFLQRVVVYNPGLEATAIVTQHWQPGVDPASERVPVILDIDVYRQVEFSSAGTEMWDYLSRLRAFKNEIFFESLTEKALELYK